MIKSSYGLAEDHLSLSCHWDQAWICGIDQQPSTSAGSRRHAFLVGSAALSNKLMVVSRASAGTLPYLGQVGFPMLLVRELGCRCLGP